MILQSSTSADKNNNFRFFKGKLKSVWTLGVISFSVMFFLGPVLLLMACNSYDATIYSPVKNISGLVEAIYSTYSLYCVFGGILAVIFAISVFNYLNSRVSVNFYHSLPFKRTRLFLVNYISGFVMFLIGFIANYLICIMIPALTQMGFLECLPAISSVFFNVIIYFLLIYSMTVLVGMTTGRSVVQLMMTLAAFALLPAIKICFNGLRVFDNSRFWIDYFLEYDKFLPTSPVVILFDNSAFSLLTKVMFVIISIVCTVASVILYHYRRSEKSGNPFVFDKFASVVKYIIMFPASMAFALIFGSLGYEMFAWLIFGSVSGAIVAWMIMNSIIAKTARAMFTSVRGMIIFTVAVTLFNAAVVYGTYPLENAMLNDTLVSSVTIELDGYGELGRASFDEPETKGALLDIIRMENGDINTPVDHSSSYMSGVVAVAYDTKYIDENNGYIKINGKEYYVGNQSADYIRVRLVAKTLFGYEIARTFTISDRMYDYFEQLKIIADSDEYKEEMLKLLDLVKEEGRVSCQLMPNMIKDGQISVVRGNSILTGFNDYSQLRYDPVIHDGLFEAYAKDIESASFDMYNAPVIGQIYVRGYNYSSNNSLPITTEFENTLDYLVECGIINSVDYVRDLSEAIRQVHVYDYLTGEVLTVTDDSQKLEAIFESVDTYDIYSQYSSFFNTVDHRYKVLFDFRYYEFDQSKEYTVDEHGVPSSEKVTYSHESTGTARAEFIDGRTPAFVNEYFDSFITQGK